MVQEYFDEAYQLLEPIKFQGDDIFDSKEWKKFSRKILREERRKGTPTKEIRTKVESLEDQLKEKLLGSKKETTSVVRRDFEKALNKLIQYKNRRLTFNMLRDGVIEPNLITKKVQVITRQQVNELNEALQALNENDPTFTTNYKVVQDFFERLFEGTGRGDLRGKVGRFNVKTDFSFYKEISLPDLGNSSERRKVYDYWEKVHGKHEDLVKAFKKFYDEVTEFEPSKSPKDKKFQQQAKEFKKFLNEEGDVIIPNYILQLDTFNLKVPDSMPIAFMILKQYLMMKGMTEQRKTSDSYETDEGAPKEDDYGEDEVYDEGAKSPRTQFKEGEAPTAEIEIKDSEFDDVDIPDIKADRNHITQVDPLYWYKYNDDYDKVTIPKDKLEGVLKVINGVNGVKVQLKDNFGESVNDFEDWFEDFTKQQDEMKGPFYLPISTFIEKDYVAKQESELDKFGRWDKIEIPMYGKPIDLGEDQLEFMKRGKIEFIRETGKPFKGVGRPQPKKVGRKKDITLTPEMLKRKLLFLATKNRPTKVMTVAQFQGKDKTLAEAYSNKEKEQANIEWAEASKGIQKEWDLTIDKLENVNESTSEFLELIAKTIEEIQTMFNVSIPRTTQTGETYSTLQAINLIGSKGEKRFIPEKLTKSWENLLDAVTDYYIIPMNSPNFVDDREKPRWVTEHASTVIKIEKQKDVPLGALQARKTLQTIELKDTNFLIQQLSKLSYEADKGDDIVKAYKDARKFVRLLNKMYGEQYNDLNKYSVFNLTYNRYGKRFLPEKAPRTLKRFWGNLEELTEGHNKADLSKAPLYTLSNIFETQLAETLGLGDRRRGSAKDFKQRGDMTLDYYSKGEQKRIEALLELKELLERLNIKSITKDINIDEMRKAEKALLSAHDAIRKMSNKPVYDSYLDTDNIEHMDIIITKIENEHKMDITAMEVDSIVKSVSSYESLAKNFGVNEDVIYTVKAMFR